MKPNPFLIGLLRENIVYIALNIVGIVLIIFVFSSNIAKVRENTQKIATLTADIQDLQKRVSIFNSPLANTEDLDTTARLLTQLIPNSEDYFSIIYSLEKLSQKTSFIITSYAINLKSSTQDRLRLSITGSGDATAFLKFLNEYNFSGGRLITSDKIELTPQVSGQIKIDVTFYTKNTKLPQNVQSLPLSPSLFQELAALKEKVGFNLKEATSSATADFNYPRKSNPF